MKKYFAIVILLISGTNNSIAQSAKGVRIGFIDMEYILENVPDYIEAKNQLEQKAQKWKQEIETRKVEIAKLKDALKTEKALLTLELISEREEEIKFRETELLNYQQKKFGPTGDLITQKSVLTKPVQDQVFNAVQDIAEAKKFDFIFDKSSDLTMLFAAKRFNISDQVIRTITRAEKREQLTNKQLKAQEAKEYKEDLENENPELALRKKALEDKKAAREKVLEDRKLLAEAKKKELEDKRKAAIEERELKKNGTIPASKEKTATDTKNTNKAPVSDPELKTEGEKTPAATQKTREEKNAERLKQIEDKKKEFDERRKKIIADKEAARKAKQIKTVETKTEEPKKN